MTVLAVLTIFLVLLVVLVVGEDAGAGVVATGTDPFRHPLVRDELGHVGAVERLERVPVVVGLLGGRWAEGESCRGFGHHFVRHLEVVKV